MADVGENIAESARLPRNALRRNDGELLLLWTLPAAGIIWVAAFLLFPGFTPPMSPGPRFGREGTHRPVAFSQTFEQIETTPQT